MSDQELLTEIEKRVKAPTSMGFSFTHYVADVTALLALVREIRESVELSIPHGVENCTCRQSGECEACCVRAWLRKVKEGETTDVGS